MQRARHAWTNRHRFFQFRRSCSRRSEHAPFAERIATAVRTHVLCESDRTQPFMQVYEHLPTAMKRQSREMRHRYAGFWIALVEAGKCSGEVRPDLDSRVFVPFFLSALNRLPEWARPGPRPLDGIRAPTRGRRYRTNR